MNQSERFYQLLEDMKKTHDAKRHDYASVEDVFANFRTCEMAGIPAWKGCCVRIGDKFSRIMGFAKKEKLKVKDESIKDTLVDMANYALIALILYEEENNEEENSYLDELEQTDNYGLIAGINNREENKLIFVENIDKVNH